MRKTVYAALLVALLALMIAPAALAETIPPTICPVGFEPHSFMDHEGDEHMHRHIGVAEDLNGNGTICVKHLKNDLHVHVDDMIP